MTARMTPPPCPRCGSNALYRDDDTINGAFCVACMKCGTRLYPGRVLEMAKADVIIKESKEEDMKRGLCANCGRERGIISGGRCSTCVNASKGLIGEAKDKALAEIKARIENGEVKTRGTAGRRRLPAQPPAPGGEKPAVQYPSERVPPDHFFSAILEQTAEPARIVPVTLQLAIEITVRINTAQA
jgi:predicted RNA-binding Zn-ribbon protein involved in translation (DUF1610 family)